VLRNITLISVILLYSFLYLTGQENHNLKSFTTENGLPYNHVLDIIQDQTGFLWISTWDGLSRYDGYEFKNYYPVPGDPNSLPFFVINKVLVDKLNNVWILCHSRPLVKYNRAKDNFESINLPGFRDSVPKYIIQSFNKDILWMFIPDDRKLYKYNVLDQRMSIVKVTDDNSSNLNDFWSYIPSVLIDNNGLFWFLKKIPGGYDIMKGVWESDSALRLEKKNPLIVSPSGPPDISGRYGYFDIFTSEAGTTWLFSGYGIFTMIPGANQFKKFTGIIQPHEFRGKPYCAWFDKQGAIHIVDPEKDKYITIPSVEGLNFQSWYIDPSHTIWYGTVSESRANMGLKMLIETPSYFRHYLSGLNEEGNPNPVFSIIKDKNGNIWAGTRGMGYVYRINPDGKIKKVRISNKSLGGQIPRVRSIISDSTQIWFGCTENTLVCYDYETGKFRSWNLSLKDSTGVKKNLGIHNILKEKEKIMISGEAVFRFNPVTNALQQKYSYPGSTALTFVKDRSNGYWAGIDKNRIIHLDSALKETKIFSVGKDLLLAEHICEGDSNDVWIALMGGGLGHVFPETGKIEIYTTANGLSNNTCYSILKDRKGNLWISTNKGISKFNPGTKQFRNFGKNEGLQIEEFNSDACYQTPEGEMFFGGVGGLISFYPDSIYDTRLIPKNAPLVITEFLVSGKVRTFKKAVYELDSLVLQKGDNNFQVTYACLNIPFAAEITYRYRLKGSDKEWTNADHRNRYINYTNLKPGDYLLEIDSTNPDGEWASHSKLHILIPFRFYETLWFKVSVLLLFFAFIIILITLYISRIRLKAAQKQDELAMESIRGQMNPHFIYNSLNSINFFIMKNDRVSANHYIADFSRLIRSILNNMSEEFIPFDQELQSISDYLKLEHLRFGDKFEYLVECNAIEDKSELWVMPGMIQPFIENAIWHGIRNLENRKGNIKVSYFLPDSGCLMKCIIEDTGVGRILSAGFKNDFSGKKSRGINIVSERLKLLSNIRHTNYKITIEDLFPDQEESGTRVIVDIPLK
jgi:streptogramin lyase